MDIVFGLLKNINSSSGLVMEVHWAELESIHSHSKSINITIMWLSYLAFVLLQFFVYWSGAFRWSRTHWFSVWGQWFLTWMVKWLCNYIVLFQSWWSFTSPLAPKTFNDIQYVHPFVYLDLMDYIDWFVDGDAFAIIVFNWMYISVFLCLFSSRFFPNPN